MTANWTQRAGSAGESPLTRQGTTGTIDTVAGIINFNPALKFNNPGFVETGRRYAGPLTRNQNWITPNNQGSAFAVGTQSDQLSALARGAGASCGTDAGRCNVGFRHDTASNTGTSFGGDPSNTPYANGANPGNRGPTANVYGLWASSGSNQHRNTRNGWNSTGTGVAKQAATDYQFRVGSFPGFSLNSHVAEVFYYDRKVTEAEAQRITTYLGIKYGITLDGDATRNNAVNFNYTSSAGTVVWAGNGATLFNAYHRNVFGLGRDSALDQRIARNINDSGPEGSYPLDILTMATGTLTAPSQFTLTRQSTGPALAQGQYLMVGNNNGSTTAATGTVVSGVAEPVQNGRWLRLNRLWRAQNTGGVGTVSLRFDVPAAGVTAMGGNLGNVVLLVDDDGNFTNGGTRVVTTGRSVSGNQVSFNVTLANGEIFTLAGSTETLTLLKTTQSAAGTYGFTLAGTTQATGTVTMAASATTQVDGNTSLAGTQPFMIAGMGTAVSITEGALPAGIHLASITCTNATTGVTFSPVYNLATRNVSIPGDSVNAGADITCTFTNMPMPPLPDFGTCDARMFLEQSNDAITINTLYDVSYGSMPFTYANMGTGLARNGIGYNMSDNYIYGMEGGTQSNRLVRVSSNGSAVVLGPISNMPTSYYNNGVISPAGDYYVIDSAVGLGNGNTLYRINITTLVATAIPLPTPLIVQDLAWYNGSLWAIRSGTLVSINPASGAVATIGPTGGPTGAISMWGFANGLFAGTGNAIYALDPVTGAATYMSATPSTSNADGANCPGASITFDADLSVTKTNTPASGPDDLPGDYYVPGEVRTYTVVVSNAASGSFGVQNATVSDPVPAGINPATVSWTCTPTSGGAVCGAGSGTGALNDTGLDLPPGAVATYHVTMTVPVGFTGDLTNTATVTPPALINDTDPSNNSATDTDQPQVTDLQVVKTASPNPVLSGEVVSYSIVLTNNGPDAASDVLLTDAATVGQDCMDPAPTATCAATGGASCPSPTVPVSALLGSGVTIPSLPVGGEVTVILQCRVTASGLP